VSIEHRLKHLEGKLSTRQKQLIVLFPGDQPPDPLPENAVLLCVEYEERELTGKEEVF
jgi:hypothetical protein